jgi:hypothetical protein
MERRPRARLGILLRLRILHADEAEFQRRHGRDGSALAGFLGQSAEDGVMTEKTITITIEAQARELLAAGWVNRSGHIWIAPSGAWYIGPHGAWKVLRGIDAAGKEAKRGR